MMNKNLMSLKYGEILPNTSVGIVRFDPLSSLECSQGRYFYFPFTHEETKAQRHLIELPYRAEPGPWGRLSTFQPFVWQGSHWPPGTHPLGLVLQGTGIQQDMDFNNETNMSSQYHTDTVPWPLGICKFICKSANNKSYNKSMQRRVEE